LKIRVKFSRGSRVKYLGHLDIMRSFQRAFIRAGIRMVYSIGFNPHQKMNFAQPLGVGVLSRGDYFDAEIADGQDPSEVLERLNSQMGEGFSVLDVKQIPEDAAKCMAAVRSAAYIVRSSGTLPDPEVFLSREEVIVSKKTKSGLSEADIRPLVYELTSDRNEYRMLISSGSENNLKPDQLVQTVFELNGCPYERSEIEITRTELYADGFVPLSSFQTL